MARDSALDPTSSEDFIGRVELQSGSIIFKDKSKRDVEITFYIGPETQVDILSESGDFHRLSPKRLADKWSDIKDGFDPRTSLRFSDSRGNERSLLLRARSIRLKEDKLILTGETITDARIRSDIGLDEMVGDDAIIKSREFVRESDLNEEISDVDFSFDTFTIREFRKRFERYYNEQLDTLEFSQKRDTQTEIYSDRQAIRGGAAMPDVPLKFNKDFVFPGSQVGVNTRLEGKPIAQISYYTPDLGHDLLDPSEWGLDLTFGFDLNGSVALLTGMQNGSGSGLKGAVPLADVYNGQIIPFIDNLRVGPDLSFDLRYNLKGVPSEYRYSATINPRATLNLNGDSKPKFRASGTPAFKTASLDPITGISIDAKVTPGFTVQYNMELKIPLLKKISSNLKGSMASPTSFSLEGLSESAPSALISSDAYFSFDGTLFEGTPFMSKLTSYRGEIYSVRSSPGI